jgi:adenine-specific DNA-methyltransferase
MAKSKSLRTPRAPTRVAPIFSDTGAATLFEGDCLDLLRSMPDASTQLVVTSPPYNLGKAYEKRGALEKYLAWQGTVIDECVRVLSPRGSICWQVGNYVNAGEIVPLDIALYPAFMKHGLKLRNRIVWHFEHGLHCSNRLSGRHETILWFTKGDDYTFNLDAIRVPQKYPGKKHFKGPNAGKLSGNPLGKNPGDVWILPNVKNNHVEKTIHPCQFPVELVERLILSLTEVGDLVLDPFAGSGTSIAAALKNARRGCGAELMPEYVTVARERILQALDGQLPTRPMNTPVYDPAKAGRSLTTNSWSVPYPAANQSPDQYRLLQERPAYRETQ